jgi:CBS domain-containing protein
MALYGVGSFLNFSIGFDLGPIGGIWLIFIGAFLYNSASQSLRATQIDDRLADIPIRELMSTELHPVDADLLIHSLAKSRDAIDTAKSYIVTENSVVVGMVSAADLLLLDDRTYSTARFGEIMTRAGSIVPMDPNASGSDALRKLRLEQVSVWPVVENGRLVGLIDTERIAEVLRRMPDDMKD